jgi:hypothetical protein
MITKDLLLKRIQGEFDWIDQVKAVSGTLPKDCETNIEIYKLALKGLAASKLEKACEFYANGAGLELCDEGRNYMPHYVAYENDFSDGGMMDAKVGETAKLALAEYRKEIEHE